MARSVSRPFAGAFVGSIECSESRTLVGAVHRGVTSAIKVAVARSVSGSLGSAVSGANGCSESRAIVGAFSFSITSANKSAITCSDFGSVGGAIAGAVTCAIARADSRSVACTDARAFHVTLRDSDAGSLAPSVAPSPAPSAAPSEAPTLVDTASDLRLFVYYKMVEDKSEIWLAEFNRKLAFALRVAIRYGAYQVV